MLKKPSSIQQRRSIERFRREFSTSTTRYYPVGWISVGLIETFCRFRPMVLRSDHKPLEVAQGEFPRLVVSLQETMEDAARQNELLSFVVSCFLGCSILR